MLRWLLKVLCLIPYRLIFWIKTINKREIKKYKGRPFILALNHRNGLDGPSMFMVFAERKLSFWIKEEFFKTKFWRWVWKGLGGVPVKEGADLSLIRGSKKQFEEKRVLFITPEGHRSFNTDKELQLRSGCAMIALMAGVPIIPVITNRAIKPFRLTKVKVGDAITSTEYLVDGKSTKDGIEKLGAALQKQMNEMLTGFEKKEKLKKWQKAPNVIGRGIVIKDEKLLVIERKKNGEVYYVLPGGHIEDGETVKEATEREIMEETGVDALAFRELYKYNYNYKGADCRGNGYQTFFVCEHKNGEPHKTDAEEYTDTTRTSGTYEPMWLPLSELKTAKLRPNCIKKQLIKDYRKKGARLSFPLRLIKGKK
jgi:1-acyl-sn-glycerol-3-phosphate acyltransferase